MLNELEQIKDHLEQAVLLAEKIHEEHPYRCEDCPFNAGEYDCHRNDLKRALAAVTRYLAAEGLKRSWPGHL